MLAMLLLALAVPLAGGPPAPLVEAAAALERFERTEDRGALASCRRLLEAAGTQAGGEYEWAKLEARLLLAEGQAQLALERAQALNRRMPDDLDGYALLAGAHRALGNLEQARRAVQWMLDLRETDVRGLEQAAALRAAHGDHSGAVDLLNECYRRTQPGDSVQRARILVQLAELLAEPQPELARQLAREALRLWPGYRRAGRMLEQEAK
jgi:Flp pilus assembly protein TadD